MYYLIDFDERCVKYKSENKSDLERYIDENELGMSVTIISSEDELCLEFSLEELAGISKSFKRNRAYANEEEAARDCWNLMNNLYSNLVATLNYGSEPIRAEKTKPSPSIFDSAPEPVSNPVGSGIDFEKPKRKRRRKLPDSTVLTTRNKPKENTVLFDVWSVVDDNFGSCAIDEILLECDMEEEKCRRAIARCIADGFLIIENKIG